MQNIIPAIQGEQLKPLLESSKWEPLTYIQGILKADVKTTTIIDDESVTTGGWDRNDGATPLYTYSQTIEITDENVIITTDSLFFVDLSLDYSTKDEILNAQEDWSLIGRAVCNENNKITFYIYEDAVPSTELHVKIGFANSAN